MPLDNHSDLLAEIRAEMRRQDEILSRGRRLARWLLAGGVLANLAVLPLGNALNLLAATFAALSLAHSVRAELAAREGRS